MNAAKKFYMMIPVTSRSLEAFSEKLEEERFVSSGEARPLTG